MLLQSAETDWLASRNIFYNIKTNQISDNINDLIDMNDIQFHPEGLYNYLDYGYSVFGQTPIKNIKILPPNASIKIENDKLNINLKDDAFERDLGKKSSVKDTLDYIDNLINKKVNEEEQEIIVPTSGGFDSRLINCMLKNVDRVHAFTYGISEKQEESYEVIYAKKLCEELSIDWHQVQLDSYVKLMDEWYNIFGISAHAHGMYHMEFYSKIRKMMQSNSLVISGLYGDLWAGNWRFGEVKDAKGLIGLSINHGIRLEPSCCKIICDHDLRDEYYEQNKEKLKDDNWRIVSAARMKIVLLSFALRIPEYYGFVSWSPYLDYGTVIKMLNLDWKEKEKRKWQVDYFRSKQKLIGELDLPCDKTNCLNFSVVKNNPLKPLDPKLLGIVIKEEVVEKINRNIRKLSQDKIDYYYAYQVLYPIQKILQMKEA